MGFYGGGGGALSGMLSINCFSIFPFTVKANSILTESLCLLRITKNKSM